MSRNGIWFPSKPRKVASSFRTQLSICWVSELRILSTKRLKRGSTRFSFFNSRSCIREDTDWSFPSRNTQSSAVLKERSACKFMFWCARSPDIIVLCRAFVVFCSTLNARYKTCITFFSTVFSKGTCLLVVWVLENIFKGFSGALQDNTGCFWPSKILRFYKICDAVAEHGRWSMVETKELLWLKTWSLKEI